MSSLLSATSLIVDACIGWCGSFVTMIVNNELLMLFVLLPVVGLGVGILRRLINL